jgi:hypothetical protein
MINVGLPISYGMCLFFWLLCLHILEPFLIIIIDKTIWFAQLDEKIKMKIEIYFIIHSFIHLKYQKYK